MLKKKKQTELEKTPLIPENGLESCGLGWRYCPALNY